MSPKQGTSNMKYVVTASVQATGIGPKGARDQFGQGVELQKLGEWPYGPATPCENENAPTVSCTVSVSLSKDDAADDAKNDWSDAYLRVEYGSGEIDTAIVELDLMNGTSFPLVARRAEFFVIYPIDAAINPDTKRQPKIDVTVSIGVGVLGASGARGCRRTVPCPTGGQGHVSAVLPIPRYAVAAVLQTASVTAIGTFTQMPSPIGNPQTLSISSVQKQEFQSVPVVHGARGFTLATAADEATAKVIFYLSPA